MRTVDTNALTPQEWEALRPHLKPRWQTYFDLLWETGIRPGEGRNVSSDDLAKTAAGYNVRVTRLKKGQKKRVDVISIPAELGDRILSFTNRVRKRPFASARDTQRQVLIRAARKAGVRESVHPHLFRHGFGRRWAKMDLGYTPSDHVAVLQQMLGHERMSTTEIYFRPSGEEVEKAWQQLRRHEGTEPAPRAEPPEWLAGVRKSLGL